MSIKVQSILPSVNHLQLKKTVHKSNLMKPIQRGALALTTMSALFFSNSCVGKQSKIQEKQNSDMTEVVADTIPNTIIEDTIYHAPDKVVVKDGDCVWNIAKDIVSENGTKEVTAPEIYKKNLEVLKRNNLHYVSDCDERVIIHKGDTLYIK